MKWNGVQCNSLTGTSGYIWIISFNVYFWSDKSTVRKIFIILPLVEFQSWQGRRCDHICHYKATLTTTTKVRWIWCNAFGIWLQKIASHSACLDQKLKFSQFGARENRNISPIKSETRVVIFKIESDIMHTHGLMFHFIAR